MHFIKKLLRRGLFCQSQKEMEVYYKGEIGGKIHCRYSSNDEIILELKAVTTLRPEHEWQLVNYLKATGLEVGLLLNFGVAAEVKRKILTHHS